MPTGRSQCGSILSGTTAIPLMHSRRIPPSQSLVGNSCNAMRVPILQRAFFWDGKADTGTMGYALLLHCYFKYMARESICVCVCVCVRTYHPAWQTRRTRNAPQSLLLMLPKGDRGGIAWSTMHGIFLNSNSLRIACGNLR